MRRVFVFVGWLLVVAVVLSACRFGNVSESLAPPTVFVPTQAVPTFSPPVSTPVSLTVLDVAPGEPVKIDSWVPGDKQGVGTAFTYDAPAGDANPSRVWFGVTRGAITEGLYPDVSTANVKAIGLLVSDGHSFLADEMRDATQTVTRLDGRTPAFRVTSTDKGGRWEATKVVAVDPAANTIMFTVSFRALRGRASDYRLYVLYTPHIGNSGRGDLSQVDGDVAEAWDEEAGIFSALRIRPAPLLLGTGYTRRNDLATDLKDYVPQTVYRSTRVPGRLTIGAQIATDVPSTLALGFGASHEQARGAVAASLARGFEAVVQEYQRGWVGYLDGLVRPMEVAPLYDVSAAVLKTHEDKTWYGAGVASLSLPWGNWRDDSDAGERGYRYVWPRDLYHVGMAMLVLGDEQGVRDTVAYLDDRLQKPDGSFPQNAFLDGRARFGGLQLDEVADPIILAWQVKAVERYESLVRPAADFIVAHGPRTDQERWEENGGYSPATLAAEVAGLVCAADMALQVGDVEGAARYAEVADAWNRRIEGWTLTTMGPLGAGRYYLRISDGEPNAATRVTIANGGGSFDQREVVDQSFLELVRLGLRRPDDPNVVATLAVVDAVLRGRTPQGDAFYRYPHDGYGERRVGEAPPGEGHLWPLLLGERAVYEVARSGDRERGLSFVRMLGAFADAGGMLPEQVFPDGGRTGSAMPLAWAHAEYVLLVHAVARGEVPDRPAVVVQRYGGR